MNKRTLTKPFKAFAKPMLLIVAGLSLAGLLSAVAADSEKPGSGVPWRTDLQAAVAEAKKAEKDVLLRFSADWCPPCRIMDANVWPEEPVIDAVAKNYAPVEIDIDTEGAAEVARHYGVRGVPTIVTLKPGGKVIARGGFMREIELLEFLKP